MSRAPDQVIEPCPPTANPPHERRKRGAASPALIKIKNQPAAAILRACGFADKEDAELVIAAKNGDGRAFEVLVERYQFRIRAIARRFTRVAEDSEDIAQQTFQKAFLHLHQFAGKSSFFSWLARIAINESLMCVRKKRASREVPIERFSAQNEHLLPFDLADPGPSPEDRYSQREWRQILARAVSELNPAIRMAIELRDLGELSTGDTAGILRISVGAVKARIFHGRQKLRVKLKRYMDSLNSRKVKQRRQASGQRALRCHLANSACD